MEEHVSGPTTLCATDKAGKFKGREGIVITPVRERMAATETSLFERVILKAIERDRERRYQSMADLLSDLHKWQRGKRYWLRTAPIVLLLAALLGASVMGIMVSTRPHAVSGVPDLVQRQVTTNPGSDSVHHAAISPDGRQLAYADFQGVHIRVLDTGEVRNITPPPGLCFR